MITLFSADGVRLAVAVHRVDLVQLQVEGSMDGPVRWPLVGDRTEDYQK